MSIDTFKRLKRDNHFALSVSPISTYSSSNVPIFNRKRTMKPTEHNNVSRLQKINLSNEEVKSVPSAPEVFSHPSSILESLKTALKTTGNYMWSTLGWNTDTVALLGNDQTIDKSMATKECYKRKFENYAYFNSPKKTRRTTKYSPNETLITKKNTQSDVILISKEEDCEKLSFSKDPFKWNEWTTTEITPTAGNFTGEEVPYGTTLRTRRREHKQASEVTQLTLRGQSEDIEYLKRIYNGEYKVPKMIEDERNEQVRLLQEDTSRNKKVKKSIIDLTERIKNILLENVDRKKTNNDDLILIKEHKISPLDIKRKEHYLNQIRFDRSLLEFDKDFKSYKELLKERKQIQEKVRRKIELAQRKELIPNITDSESKKVETIWKERDNYVLMNKDNLEVNVRDFKTLTPRRWLNDTVIEFFMKHVEKHNDKIVAFNSFFYTNLSERGYQSVRRWMKRKKAKIMDLNKVFIPINLNQSHWALGMVDITRKRIVYVDSLSNGPNAVSFAILSDIQNYVVEESGSAIGSDFELENLQCPQQPNGFDCGIYLCMNTLYLSQDSSLTFDQNDAIKMRKYIAHLILSAKS